MRALEEDNRELRQRVASLEEQDNGGLRRRVAELEENVRVLLARVEHQAQGQQGGSSATEHIRGCSQIMQQPVAPCRQACAAPRYPRRAQPPPSRSHQATTMSHRSPVVTPGNRFVRDARVLLDPGVRGAAAAGQLRG